MYQKITFVLLLWKNPLLFLRLFPGQDSFHVSQLGGSIQKCSHWVCLSMKGNEGMMTGSMIYSMVTGCDVLACCNLLPYGTQYTLAQMLFGLHPFSPFGLFILNA
jgi:hypothetical protein